MTIGTISSSSRVGAAAGALGWSVRNTCTGTGRAGICSTGGGSVMALLPVLGRRVSKSLPPFECIATVLADQIGAPTAGIGYGFHVNFVAIGQRDFSNHGVAPHTTTKSTDWDGEREIVVVLFVLPLTD